MGALFDAMMAAEAKRASAKRKPSIVDPPEGAVTLWRPDTKRPKAMGWGFHGTLRAIVYLAQLKTKSTNAMLSSFFAAGRVPGRAQSLAISMRAANASQHARARSALEQLGVMKRAASERPKRVVLTRVRSGGGLDGDGLQGSLKHVRDGVAAALLIDDRLFDRGGIELVYQQASPGRRGAWGVKIEVEWKLDWVMEDGR